MSCVNVYAGVGRGHHLVAVGGWDGIMRLYDENLVEKSRHLLGNGTLSPANF